MRTTKIHIVRKVWESRVSLLWILFDIVFLFHCFVILFSQFPLTELSILLIKFILLHCDCSSSLLLADYILYKSSMVTAKHFRRFLKFFVTSSWSFYLNAGVMDNALNALMHTSFIVKTLVPLYNVPRVGVEALSIHIMPLQCLIIHGFISRAGPHSHNRSPVTPMFFKNILEAVFNFFKNPIRINTWNPYH